MSTEWIVKKDRTKKLMKSFEQLQKSYVTVGIHAQEGSKRILTKSGGKKFNVLKLATQNEFGTSYTVDKARRFSSPFTGEWFYLKKGTRITIPARTFIRKLYLDKKERDNVGDVIEMLYGGIIEGKRSAPNALKMLSAFVENQMKGFISGNKIKPSNKPMTTKYKSGSKPLFATGKHIFDNIKAKVRKI
jgi:hypothetical protein